MREQAHPDHRRRRADRLAHRRSARRRAAARDRRPRQLRARPAREPRRRRCRGAASRSSRATSATAPLLAERHARASTSSSTRRRSASRSAPKSRALALDVLVDGTFNVLEAAVKAGVAKVVAASSASVYGAGRRLPDRPSSITPTTTARIYGAAKAFNEGLLRSFNEMYGLKYVALRYFNVYGPRMDVYGAYTEVLIRWMERIAAGQPPLIFGDGTQTMDFVHVARHRPGEHARRESRRSPTRSSTSRAAPRPACNELRGDAAARHGLVDSRPSTRRRARSTRCRAGSPTRARPSRMLGFEADDLARGGPARRWSSGGGSERATAQVVA